MTIVLSAQEYDDLWEQSKQLGTVLADSDGLTTGYQGQVSLIGNVKEWFLPLQEGLRLRLYDYELTNDLRLNEQYGENAWSTLSFFIAGDVRTTLKGVTDPINELAGRTYLSCCSEVHETEDWVAGQRLIRLYIDFNPSIFLKNFPLNQMSALVPEIQQAAEGKIQPYYYQGSMTPMSQAVVHQILNCPHHGIIKRLYLESKTLELMMLQFSQFQESDRVTSQKTFLRSDDIDRIYHARDILIENLHNPPSLLELARQVAVNDYKLKQGFRQVFGTTVFGYLHDYRLEKARFLLQTCELSITEVVHQVGFVDRSYFASAFRKKFGLNPSEYARQHRGKARN
ncbi:helix-turn-helix transcriptional regulator [Leptolyngbya sp. AN03gr2]|uniref:AraC family transcriptional regulator n=1 Tax=unclassified Leptolyngbya TaxID=2650499 RepID=UPI003D323CDE